MSQLREETPDVLVLDPGLPWGGGDGVLALMREDKTVPKVPTLLHSWNPGTSYPDDAAFPIVRRTTKLLGLSQMEAEIRAICYHAGDVLDQGIGRCHGGRATMSAVKTQPGRRTAVKFEGWTGVLAPTLNNPEEVEP